MAKRLTKPPQRTSSSAAGASEPREDSGSYQTIIAGLEEGLRARDDFLAIAAHELRNPITPIQLCVEAMRMALRAHDYQKVHLQAERLDRLLNHFLQRASVLLDVARLTTDRLSLEFAEFDLSELVHSTIDELRPMLARSGSDLKSNIQGNVICVLDPMSLRQILENLLSNAIKYGEGKPIEVTVAADMTTVEIAVRDHGIGIEENEKQRIFGRFERAVAASGQPGFGIGLWVSRKLVESMRVRSR